MSSIWEKVSQAFFLLCLRLIGREKVTHASSQIFLDTFSSVKLPKIYWQVYFIFLCCPWSCKEIILLVDILFQFYIHKHQVEKTDITCWLFCWVHFSKKPFIVFTCFELKFTVAPKVIKTLDITDIFAVVWCCDDITGIIWTFKLLCVFERAVMRLTLQWDDPLMRPILGFWRVSLVRGVFLAI